MQVLARAIMRSGRIAEHLDTSRCMGEGGSKETVNTGALSHHDLVQYSIFAWK